MNELAKFGEAANKLADILKDAAGIIIEPAKKYTNSQVEMYIEKKRVKHSIELEKIDLEERAKLRLFETEIRRQHNLESIGFKAIKQLPPHAKPEEIDIDWLHHFSDCCKDVGEDELRNIWANILSKEATKRGQFSKRTINALKNFSISDCKIFDAFSTYIGKFNNSIYFLINPTNCYDYHFFNDSEISYRELLHMNHLNLISDNSNAVFTLDPSELITFQIQNKEITLENETEKIISQQYYIVTDIGMELMKIVLSKSDELYFKKLKEHFLRSKIKVNEK